MSSHDLSRRTFLGGVAAATATAALAASSESAPPSPPSPAAAKSPRQSGLRFGVTAAPTATYDEVRAIWQDGERLGFDSAFVYDHFMGIAPGAPATERCFESWTLLAALAVQTTRLRCGVLVSGNTYRHPPVLAKMAATVDHVSGGRLILGMGAAWLEREHTALGIPFYTPGERAHRLAEAVEVVTQLFTQERATFTGKFYTLKDAPCEPKPLQRPHPPILIGGMGAKVVMPLAAKHAQIWHFLAPPTDPDAPAKLCAAFDELCRKAGRDPSAIEKATSLDPAKPSAELKERVQALAALGVKHFVLLPPPNGDRAAIQRFAAEVMA